MIIEDCNSDTRDPDTNQGLYHLHFSFSTKTSWFIRETIEKYGTFNFWLPSFATGYKF